MKPTSLKREGRGGVTFKESASNTKIRGMGLV